MALPAGVQVGKCGPGCVSPVCVGGGVACGGVVVW